MARRKRSDSASVAIEAAQAPQVVPPSTISLTKDQKAFFVNIIAEAARMEWTPHTVELAAMLARAMASLNFEQKQLEKEGTVIEQSTGNLRPNPRFTVVRGLMADIVNIRRSLQIHARAKNGPADEQAVRRADMKAAENNDLLARPN